MTGSPGGDAALPSPPAAALAIALDLVTRYRLRLVDPRDGRLGPLLGRYELAAAAWTGRRAAFVGFFTPLSDPTAATQDLDRRLRDATEWATERLSAQGAERCDVLLVALGRVGRPSLPALGGRVHVGAAGVDGGAGSAQALTPLPPGLPGLAELRAHARGVRDGRPVPTLAAVDLAERQVVAGGYAAPSRQALTSTPTVTYALIGAFVAVWIAERALISTDPLAPTHVSLIDFGALTNSGALRGDWWRYISSAFLHDDSGIFHILSNGFAMYFIGRLVEQLYGRLALLGMFLATAALGGAFWVALTAAGIASPNAIGVGASGGISGLVGLLVVLGRVQGRDVPVGVAAQVRQYAVTIAVLNLVLGFAIANVNNVVHIGGFVSGALLGLLLPPRAAVGGRELRLHERAGLVVVVAVSCVALGFALAHLASAAGSNSGPAPGPV